MINKNKFSVEKYSKNIKIDEPTKLFEHIGKGSEDLTKEITKIKLELERSHYEKEALERQNRELSILLDEMKEKDMISTEQVLRYKGKINNTQTTEECKKTVRNDTKRNEDKLLVEISDLHEKLAYELTRRNQLETELQRSNNENYSNDNKIRRYQSQINDLHDEIQESLKKWEQDKLKLSSELEKCYLEIASLKKKNESLIIEKNESHALFDKEIQREVEKFNTEITEYKFKLEQMKKDMDRLNNEYFNKMNDYSKENNDLKRKMQASKEQIERVCNDNDELNQKINYLVNEKEETFVRFNDEIEKAIAENNKIEDDNHRMEIENCRLQEEYTRLQEEYNRLKDESQQMKNENQRSTTTLSGEIQGLLKELSELRKKMEEIYQEKDKGLRENDKLIRENDKIIRENERLLRENEKFMEELKKYSLKTQNLTQENEEIQRKLEDLAADKEELIFRLSSELASSQKENDDIKKDLFEKESEIQITESNLSTFMHENNFLKQNIQELKTEIEKLNEINIENQQIIEEINNSKDNLKYNYEDSAEENKRLKEQVAELEEKNREIFHNLEKDLAQRAKDYKERTMNILNVQRSNSSMSLVENNENLYSQRSKSPYLRPSTPFERVEINRLENEPGNGNAAAKLLQALDKSPRGRNTLVKNSVTPTKETIKSRIANLLQNRNRIGEEISKFE